MILHPGILALLIGSGASLLLLCYGAAIGGVIYRRWNFSSSSSYQLGLERKTYLVSTLVKFALGFQIGSAILYVYTMDDIHPLFIGAMCATGSLNANLIGWYGLYSKILLLFLSGFWLALNHLDLSVETYPLVRIKYLLLLLLVPFIFIDAGLQLSYFLGLNPDIITSCCGSLFGGGSDQAISTVTSLPVRPTMVVYSCIVISYVIVYCLNIKLSTFRVRYIFSVVTILLFVSSLAALISFVSIYIYELPTHHCPFDILQREYYFVGYPLYVTLFTGGFFGMLPGLFQTLKRSSDLVQIVNKYERQWIHFSMIFFTCFVLLVIYTVYTSNLNYV